MMYEDAVFVLKVSFLGPLLLPGINTIRFRSLNVNGNLPNFQELRFFINP